MDQDFILEVGATAAVIAHNMFDEVKDSVKEGMIDTYYTISRLSREFEEKHQHIGDWAKYADSIGETDWEDCVLAWVKDEIDNQK